MIVARSTISGNHANCGIVVTRYLVLVSKNGKALNVVVLRAVVAEYFYFISGCYK